ncbi:PH domain-containing protein [Demequina salsinemoris]|uniref:PH domain-containing protein n=1 Tax=Demequina salsinemoris TaxID=577470 RepID=UPI000AB303F7|nr:PH domain-containing protein [Demequina salsinemoris]
MVNTAPREWTRMHPVSPFLGAWSVFGAIGAYWFFNNAPEWAGGGGDGWRPAIITLVLIGLVIAVFVVAGAYLSWRMTTYRITDDSVELRKGILFRQSKQARLDRLQAVDVVQPLLARVFGFAAVRIEVAGGEGSTVALEYLRLGDAEALRNEILALAAGIKQARQGTAIPGTMPGTGTMLGSGPSVGAGLAGAGPAGAGFSGGAEASEHGSEHGSDHGAVLRDFIPGADQGVPAIAAAAERDLLVVPPGRLIGSIVLSGPFLWLAAIPLGLLVAVLVLTSEVEHMLFAIIGSSFAGLIPVLFAGAGFVWSRLNTGFGFVAGISADGVRLRHGLLETRRQTVPPGRVQAVQMHQPLLWRRRGWWRLSVNVAGYQESEANVSTLLPVGTQADALAALWLVLPDLGDPDPAGTIARAMTGTGAEGGFTASPRSSRWFDPFQWKHRGVRATDTALLIRQGRWVRELVVVPHERTQSLGLSQGPLQRAAEVATVVVHSTPGPVSPVACHLSRDDAFALLEEQAARAATSRKRQTPEQWLATVVPAVDEVLAGDDVTVAPDGERPAQRGDAPGSGGLTDNQVPDPTQHTPGGER